MKEWKIGLIGCGGMAGFYRNVYTQIPGAKLDFVVGLESDEPQRLAKEIGASGWSTKFEDCLNSDVDIVDISTPNHLHEEQFIKAVKANKHILIQKPLASDISSAVKMLEYAEGASVKTGVFMSRHGMAVYYIIKDLIDNGFIGKVSSAYARTAMIRKAEANAAKNWRNSIEKTGGGALLQLGIHDYDMLEWLLGEKIVSVTAKCNNIMSPHIGGEDTAHTVVTFGNGVSAVVESSYCSRNYFFEVFGSEGSIYYEGGELVLYSTQSYDDENISYNEPGIKKHYKIPCDNAVIYSGSNRYEQHKAFVEAVMNGKPAPISIRRGVESLAVVKAAYKSSQTGKTIMMKDFMRKEGVL